MGECPCYTCMRTKTDPHTGWPLTTMRMIVCPDCGNKRCPKSTHHDNACTGSNEPGQKGSRYQ